VMIIWSTTVSRMRKWKCAGAAAGYYYYSADSMHVALHHIPPVSLVVRSVRDGIRMSPGDDVGLLHWTIVAVVVVEAELEVVVIRYRVTMMILK
jgi:hypothetical protein